MERIELTDIGLKDIFMNKLIWKILKENCAQIEKWGYQTHTINEWQTIITEEVGEVARHLWDYHDTHIPGDLIMLKKEIIQVITLYSKLYEMLSDFDNHEDND